MIVFYRYLIQAKVLSIHTKIKFLRKNNLITVVAKHIENNYAAIYTFLIKYKALKRLQSQKKAE